MQSSSSSKHSVRVQRGEPQGSRQLEMESGEVFRSRSHISSRESEDVGRSGESRAGVRTVHTTRVVKHLTTSSRGENQSVTETFVTCGGGKAQEPSVIDQQQAPPEIRSTSKTTTKVVKQARGATASGVAKSGKSSITATAHTQAGPLKPAGPSKKARGPARSRPREVEPSQRPKISDIITQTGIADESVTAREALLRWAQRTTERYPGVKISDFTNSWKDGLAFSAIIHRNRPDLLDFYSLRTRSAHDNLENAFGIAEKEFGITRLLDPEDVDTPEPDERSIITYISSMYDVFPEPPVSHPLVDNERQKKIEDYRESTIALQMWLLESANTLKRRVFPDTVVELKAILADCGHIRSVEVPKYLKEKQRLSHLYKEIQKLSSESSQVTFEGDLRLESVEKNWEQLMSAIQDKEKAIREEIVRLEKLQKLADKIKKEIKLCDGKLDDAEKKIEEEMKRSERLQSIDVKLISEHIESCMRNIDISLDQMKSDANDLFRNGYSKANEIENRVLVLQRRYHSIRNTFQMEILPTLTEKTLKIDEKKSVRRVGSANQKSSETAKLLQTVKEHSEWVEKKMKKLQAVEMGSDISSIKTNLEQHKNEHKCIDSYSKKIEKCSSYKGTCTEDEYNYFSEAVNNLDKSYKTLKNLSSGVLHEFESLFDFVSSASKELKWISDKIDVEITRDWSSKTLNLNQLENYQESLTVDLEKHELQLNAIQSAAENLLLQKHQAASSIESYISQLQSSWSWLLQLALSLETHLKHTQFYYQFFKECKECEQFLKTAEEKLNTTFSRTVISVDEGEKSLKELHRLKEELTNHNSSIQSIINRSTSIVQLKQRKQVVSKPLKIVAVCNYKGENVSICKDDCCTLQECSQKNKWKITTSQGEAVVPSVCFVIPSPNPEATEFAERLKKKYNSIISLWTVKEKKLHQNLIIATMKVVKSWDETKFQAMETSQRDSIIRALNEDAEKLINEGSSDDPNLKKLKQELDNCNCVFQSLKERMNKNGSKEAFVAKEHLLPKEMKLSSKTLLDEITSLQVELNGKESILKKNIDEQMHWDVDTLENLVLNHKELEISLRGLEDKMKQIKQSFSTLTKKTSSLQTHYHHLVTTWDKIWNLSNLFVERLKAVETAVNAFNEATQVVSGLEVHLASFENMPSDMNEMHKVHDTLLSLQAQVLQQQQILETVLQSFQTVKKLMQRTRSKQCFSSDVLKFENDIKKLNIRWENVSSQIIERLQSCGATSELLHNYETKLAQDHQWIRETTVKIDTLKTVKTLTTNDIDKQVEPVMNLYSSTVDHSSSIEQTNVLGARYIREAKIYDLRLKHYKENLEEEHPSLDASLLKKPKLASGVYSVEHELDDLNLKYEKVVGSILDYIKELKILCSQSDKFQLCKIMSNAVPVSLKTFHAVIGQQSPESILEMEISHLHSRDTDFKYVTSVEIPRRAFLHGSLAEELIFPEMPQNCLQLTSATKPISAIQNVPLENICVVKGVYNSITGQKLTLSESIKFGIIDSNMEKFTDLKTGRQLTLQDAVMLGYIEPSLYERITTKCGIFFPGVKEELSFIDAIRKKLFDIDNGTFLNPQDHSSITLTDAFHIGVLKKPGIKLMIEKSFIKASNLTFSEAIEKEFLDPKTGVFHDPLSGLSMDLPSAFDKGFISVSSIKNEMGFSLHEAISRSMAHDESGQIIDPDSGDKYTINEAIARGILRSDVREVVDSDTLKLHTLCEAMTLGIFDANKGKYVKKGDETKLNMSEAQSIGLIFKPLTMKQALENKLWNDSNGMIINPLTGEKLSVISALALGILDSESKCIFDPETHTMYTIPLALKLGVLTPSGKFCNRTNNQMLSLKEAERCGFLTTLDTKTIFEVEGIKDTSSGELLSFNEALSKNVIDLHNNHYIDHVSNKKFTLEEACAQSLFHHQIFEMLSQPIGIMSCIGSELTVLECVKNGILDNATGLLKDPQSKESLSIKEAVQKGVISQGGAELLKGLLNIAITATTLTRTVTSFVNVSDSNSGKCELEKMNMADVEDSKNAELSCNIFERNILIDDSQSKFVRQTLLVDSLKYAESDEIPEKSPTSSMKIDVHNYLKDRESIAYESDTSVNAFGSTSIHNIQMDKNFSSFQTEKCPSARSLKNSFDSQNLENNSSPFSTLTVFELPSDGWLFIEALKNNMLDVTTGIFTVPGTNHQMTLEEAVHKEIINPNSAFVLDPTSNNLVGLSDALCKTILDSTGHYINSVDRYKLTAKAAIERGLIVCLTDRSALDKICSTEVDNITCSNISLVSLAKGDIGTCEDNNQLQKMQKTSAADESHLFQIHPDLHFDQNSLKIIKKSEELDLLTCLIDGTVDTSLFAVRKPKSDVFMDLREALDQSIVDPSSGNYNVGNGETPLSFKTAFEMGLITYIKAEHKTPCVSQQEISSIDSKMVSPKDKKEVIDISKAKPVLESSINSSDSCAEFWPLSSVSENYQINSGEIKLRTRTIKSAINDETGEDIFELPRISRKMISLEDAVKLQLIDSRTFHMLHNSFSSYESGSTSTLEHALDQNLIKDDEGEIINIRTGKKVGVKEAVKHDILEPNTMNLMIPVGHPLSLPEAYNQGLIEPVSKKIIHPETGMLLNLKHAILCDIINPLSLVENPFSKTIVTMEKSIGDNVIDAENNIVNLPDKSVDIVEALHTTKIFKLPEKICKYVIPLAPTLPVAVQYKIIDLGNEIYTHPFTKERISLHDAIENNAVMVVPKPENPNYILLSDALKSNLISENMFRNLHTGELMPIHDAVESGLLVVKPVTKKYTLLHSTLIVRSKQAVCSKKPSTSIDFDATSNVSSDGVSSKQNVKHSRDALDKNHFSSEMEHDSRVSEMNFCIDTSNETGALQYMNDFEKCFKSSNFIDEYNKFFEKGTELATDSGSSNHSVTFKSLVETGVFDPDLTFYIDEKKKLITLNEALEQNILVPKSGNYVHVETGKEMPLVEAIKLGLIAVVGLPVLATHKFFSAVKSVTSKETSQETVTLDKVLNIQENIDPLDESYKSKNNFNDLHEKNNQCSSPKEYGSSTVSQHLLTDVKSCSSLKLSEFEINKLISLNTEKISGHSQEQTEYHLSKCEETYSESDVPGTVDTYFTENNITEVTSALSDIRVNVNNVSSFSLAHDKGSNTNNLHDFLLHDTCGKNTLYDDEEKICDSNVSPNSIKTHTELLCTEVTKTEVKQFSEKDFKAEEVLQEFVHEKSSNELPYLVHESSEEFANSISTSSDSSCKNMTDKNLLVEEDEFKKISTSNEENDQERITNTKSIRELIQLPLTTIAENSMQVYKPSSELCPDKVSDSMLHEQSLQSVLHLSDKMSHQCVKKSLESSMASNISCESLCEVMKRTELSSKQSHIDLKALSDLQSKHYSHSVKISSVSEWDTKPCQEKVILTKPIDELPFNSNHRSKVIQKPKHILDTTKETYLDPVPVETQDSAPKISSSQHEPISYKSISTTIPQENSLSVRLQTENISPSSSHEYLEILTKYSQLSPITDMNPLSKSSEFSSVGLTSKRPPNLQLSKTSNVEINQSTKIDISEPVLHYNVCSPSKQQEDTFLVKPPASLSTLEKDISSLKLPHELPSNKSVFVSASESVLQPAQVLLSQKSDSYIRHSLLPDQGLMSDLQNRSSYLSSYLSAPASAGSSHSTMKSVLTNQHDTSLLEGNKSLTNQDSLARLTSVQQHMLSPELLAKDNGSESNQFPEPKCSSDVIPLPLDQNVLHSHETVMEKGKSTHIILIDEYDHLHLDSHPLCSEKETDESVTETFYITDTPTQKPSFKTGLPKQTATVHSPPFVEKVEMKLPANKEIDNIHEISIKDAIQLTSINPDECCATLGREKVFIAQALETNLVQDQTTIKLISDMEAVLDEQKHSVIPGQEPELSNSCIEENYKTCKGNISKLLFWVSEIEQNLASLGLVKEDLTSLQDQISTTKALKDELVSQQHLINTCIDQVHHLEKQGLEVLSREEVEGLIKDLQSVKKRYELLMNECDRLLRRLIAAFEELQKFKTEIHTFRQWLKSTHKTFVGKEDSLKHLKLLNDNFEQYREFANDVIAHQADIRYITIAAQKFTDESKDYLKILNLFRVSLTQQLPHLEPIDSQVKSEVHEVSTFFFDLLNNVNKLSDRFTVLCGKYQYYVESYQKASSWFDGTKKLAQKVLAESVSAEPSAVQEQLDSVKTLNMEIVGQGRLVENAQHAWKSLSDALNNYDIKSPEIQSIESAISTLNDEYNSVLKKISLKIKELQTALIHSQDIQDGLDRLLRWLNETDVNLQNQSKPISLNPEKLSEQVQEFKVLHSDVNNQKQSIDMINASAKSLMSSNPKSVQKIECKLKEFNNNFEKLCERIVKREKLLEEVSSSVKTFEAIAVQFEEFTASLLERLESHDIVQELDLDGFASIVENMMNQRNSKQIDYEKVMKISKSLVSRSDVSDTVYLKEKVKVLEQSWKHLGHIISEKQMLGKARSEQLSAWESLRSKVLGWLSKKEATAENLAPISLDYKELKKQVDDLKLLVKDYTEYNSTIEKLNTLGSSIDITTKGDTSHPKASSPLRKSSPTRKSPSKAKSPDSYPASPTKVQTITQSPLSTASSGFSSRRSSTDNFCSVEELSPIQQQMSEINHRYSLLGIKLNDQLQEIDQLSRELPIVLETMKMLKIFLDMKQKQLPKERAPSSKDEAEKYLKLLQTIHYEIMEKQSELDSFKSRMQQVLCKKVEGYLKLQQEIAAIEEEWTQLKANVNENIMTFQDCKDFDEAFLQLQSWLLQREKMYQVLGPIASDPRIISSQVQQVQVMKDEFSSQKSLLDQLKECSKATIEHFDASSGNVKRIKEQLSSICNLWDDLFHRLEDRDRHLQIASEVAKEFYSSQSQIQSKVQKINDSFDSFLESNIITEEQLKKLIVLEEQLEKQRPSLTDVDSICEKLCEIMQDSSSRNDLRNKISTLEKLYSTLYKKINNRKAEMEACLKEDKVFYQSCDEIKKWLDKTEKLMSTDIILSADLSALMKQVEMFEPCYKSVMNREHELHLLLSKGEDMLGRLTNKQEHNLLKLRLENTKKQYELLKKGALNRHTSLQCFLDNYKKYDAAIHEFAPWLERSYNKLLQISISTLQRSALNKEIKEVQVLKNDVTKHMQEYENIRSLGDTLLLSCNGEKEKIKKQLSNLQKKWELLNQELTEKMQSFDDLSQKFVEYNEKLRDLQHSVQRLEDKLSSHDALGSVSRDPILLSRLKELQKESVDMTKQLESLKQFSKNLVSSAGSKADVSKMKEEIGAVETKLNSLIKSLQDRSSKLATSAKVVSTFTAQVKSVHSELDALDDIFEKFSPVGRHKSVIQQQLTEIKEFFSKVIKVRSMLENTEKQCKDIISEGHLPDSDAFKEQLSSLHKKISKLEEHAKVRETTLQTILKRITQFSVTYQSTRKQLEEVIRQEQSFATTGGDLGTIKAQQENFKKFKNEQVHPLNKVIDECHKLGQGIIQSAATGVCTNDLERDLDSLNELWNNLQEKITEHEKKLDVALLQSGKFQEALDGVKKWLADTEELVCNQKAPSSDYKVVKAQVQEQKFLKKMLLDRQNSVVSLKITGSDLMQTTAKKKEQEQVDVQMLAIIQRFEELNATAEERMKLLEKTIPVAQDFQNSMSSLQEWIEQIEKKLTSTATIPVEREMVKKKILELKATHEDITSHKHELDKLKMICEKLKKFVGKDEVHLLEQKIQSINTRYTKLTEISSQTSKDLHSAEKGLVIFTEKYEKSLTWIEKNLVHITSFQTFSIYTDKLETQFKEIKKLKDNVAKEQANVAYIISSGQDLMKHATGEDTIHVKQKLDTLNVKFAELSNIISERLKMSEELLPLVKSFYSSSTKLSSWLDSAERTMKSLDGSSLDVQKTTIKHLQVDIQDHRSLLETVNHTGPRISQICPGDGASAIENTISKMNHRFDGLSELVQRKAERIELAVQRKFDVVGDMDEVMDWFKDVEKQVQKAEGLSPEPNSLLSLLNQQKVINNEVNSQKSRVREILANAKKLMRESSTEDVSFIHDKAETLKNLSSSIAAACQDRLSIIEQALPLAKHFFETHSDLGQWLDVAEGEAELLEAPALSSSQIKKQQDRNKGLVQSVNEHKPLVDKLNKTGSALCKLCKEEETEKVDVILESDNSRYNALRKILREHQSALEEALQATSQFSDKLEGMLNALTSTADQIQNAEPISAHPEKIQEQINDNKAVLQDLEKRTSALEAVKKTADEVIIKAGSIDEPAVKDIRKKLDHLNFLWETIQTAARNRGKSLEEALIAAEKFWDELTAVMKALKDLQENLNNQESPAVEPNAVQQQQEVLQEIKQEISQTKPEVDHCRQAGQDLMQLCGEPDKPEVKKHIEDLDSVWENVTTLYAKREQNLIDALEKAMSFHDTLQSLLEFLDMAEEKFSNLGAVSSDIDSVKNQVNQLKEFKSEVDPHMVEVESINRQAQELVERTSPDQSLAIREPLDDINKRWNTLLKSIVDRQQQMESVLLKLGQFQHSLDELAIWITKAENSLDELKSVFGDTQVIEVVLAKLKVLMNDIQAHESSIDAINRAGRQFAEAEITEDVKSTQNVLTALNIRWQQLQENAAERQRELQEALKEALQFHQEIQDLLMWLSDIDGQLVTSKPVGGLPETAKEQLNKFMDLYSELDSNRHKVENIMQQGQIYSKKSGENSTKRLQHNLHVLHQRWDSIQNKANDRKIKLEIALREATEFHEALQVFVEWLTNSEKYLTSLKPVSRSMKLVLEQIEDHRNFQKDVGSHREVMINLDKKGTHLKYFSQKQDVILIKNLLISVQHRWERVVSKVAERTRLLDHGYKEAKEFHDAWTSLSNWLEEAEKTLDSITHIGNDPTKIKQLLSKHKEFQRVLGSKQVSFDSTMRSGRALKEKCPKHDVHFLQNMMDELKTRWNRVCSKSVDRQRKLEEALLFSGQFKEAVQALLDWLDKAIFKLSEAKNYHGDLDTVTALIEKHKAFQEELSNRNASLNTIRKSAKGLKESANIEETTHISTELEKLESKWTTLIGLSDGYKSNLDSALELAEKLHKSVHVLLEWLSDAEIKLRFVGPLPEDEDATNAQIAVHQEFLKEISKRETDKDDILLVAHDILKKCHPDGLSTIRQWITIIQSRWEEISLWAKQRNQRLLDHLRSLKDVMELLEELLAWLIDAEAKLTALEAESLPDDLSILEQLIKEHQTFMDEMTKKQSDVEKITKAFSSKREASSTVQHPTKDKHVKERTQGAPMPLKTSTPLKKSSEPDIKHPRARLLLEKWRQVWLLAMERQRRLQDKYNYLKDLDRIKNFDFDEWRRKYLNWLSNKKSRVMDQFRKIDKNSDGKVTKQEFIDGIVNSKFVTSRLEMERVAEIFDINGDGFIDTKEYIDTLRPEREGYPKTEAEKIQDEVQRQVAKCTCVHRFKVYQVGEGKYRFGDSQKLRLVRILRSTVMVRVGGGWVALDEFLVKNDPCRAKGRTNLELREQFILAEGVSQSMSPFKPKPSPNSSVSSQSGTSPRSIPSAGPITKIREKSERSTPMHHSRSSADSSSDISGPGLSDMKSSSNKSAFSRLTSTSNRLGTRAVGSRPNSRSSSQPGSRPSSRAASDLSQDALEKYKTGGSPADNHAVSSSSVAAAKGSSTPTAGSKIPSVKRSAIHGKEDQKQGSKTK